MYTECRALQGVRVDVRGKRSVLLPLKIKTHNHSVSVYVAVSPAFSVSLCPFCIIIFSAETNPLS